MVLTVSDDFDLKKIAESGQCFRWRNKGDGYSILCGNRVLEIHPVVNARGEFNISCTSDEWERFWADYFDICFIIADWKGTMNKIGLWGAAELVFHESIGKVLDRIG